MEQSRQPTLTRLESMAACLYAAAHSITFTEAAAVVKRDACGFSGPSPFAMAQAALDHIPYLPKDPAKDYGLVVNQDVAFGLYGGGRRERIGDDGPDVLAAEENLDASMPPCAAAFIEIYVSGMGSSFSMDLRFKTPENARTMRDLISAAQGSLGGSSFRDDFGREIMFRASDIVAVVLDIRE